MEKGKAQARKEDVWEYETREEKEKVVVSATTSKFNLSTVGVGQTQSPLPLFHLSMQSPATQLTDTYQVVILYPGRHCGQHRQY